MAPVTSKKRPSARAKTLVARTSWADSPALYARVQPETLAKARRMAAADTRSMASWLDRLIASLPEVLP